MVKNSCVKSLRILNKKFSADKFLIISLQIVTSKTKLMKYCKRVEPSLHIARFKAGMINSLPANRAKMRYRVPISLALVEKSQRASILLK